MRIKWFKILVLVLSINLLYTCANRGRPSGGEKDIDAPLITKEVPENFSTNFKGNEIRIYFNEYIKVKNLQKQLIISPPMDTEPTVTPLGSASKYIKIIINDTLEDNTTYAFNFGQSIVDNNEENPYEYYRYVFSTGDVIDSLSVKGTIMDAEKLKPDTFVSVMLYELDSTYTDSTVYKQKPKYITNTLDSLTSFSIDNIKEGQYKLIAIKDENGNFTFQQKSDKIGFYEDVISVPTDSTYTIKLFKEVLEFDAKRPKQIAGQKIGFGYDGDNQDMTIELLGDVPEGFEKRITKDKTKDTLYYWYKPKIEIDSAQFVIRNNTFVDTLTHKFRDIERDSLIIRAVQSGIINFTDDFILEGTVPFVNIDEKQVTILDKDSINVPFTTSFDELMNRCHFKFEKKESDNYNIQILPNTFEDFFGHVNDTLNYALRTKTLADYTNIRVRLENAEYPVIVQLTTEKGEVKYEQFGTEPRLFDFKNLDPNDYYIRVIYDTNGNQKWDSGNFLLQQQPERVSYASGIVEGRAGWDYPEEIFKLD
ncbi:Ig-like domain-containing protein [Psychroserpens ponticola]|uniref:Ig-like domain-containing protein n=1 Tax=Psychroserpens ponticola TaxID=2932268 RepID=A0ABY7RWE2_9FLAO|nr:Ig-like domain-containing protein [Psychroserpens ponticola]WCO01435.1 Ig-like domain-containing protein [Psychroserpens ponticola]